MKPDGIGLHIQSRAISDKLLETVTLGGRRHLRVLGVNSFQLRTYRVAVAIRSRAPFTAQLESHDPDVVGSEDAGAAPAPAAGPMSLFINAD